MVWAQEQKNKTAMVEQKSFSGNNKVLLCFRAWEIIPLALPNLVDSFIIKMINLIVWLIGIWISPLNKSIRKPLCRCLVKNRHCDYVLCFLSLPTFYIFVPWKMTTRFSLPLSLPMITSPRCQQYTWISAHLALWYCLLRAMRDDLESREVLPFPCVC